jgi:hypothetical protein
MSEMELYFCRTTGEEISPSMFDHDIESNSFPLENL